VAPVLLIQEPSWTTVLSDGRLRFFPRMTWLRIDLRDAASGLAFVDVTKMKAVDGCFATPPGEPDTLVGERVAGRFDIAIESILERPMARGVQVPGPACGAKSFFRVRVGLRFLCAASDTSGSEGNEGERSQFGLAWTK